MVQCAGTIFHNPVAYLTYANSNSWIIDLNASEHVSFDSQFLTSLAPFPSLLIINLSNPSGLRSLMAELSLCILILSYIMWSLFPHSGLIPYQYRNFVNKWYAFSCFLLPFVLCRTFQWRLLWFLVKQGIWFTCRSLLLVSFKKNFSTTVTSKSSVLPTNCTSSYSSISILVSSKSDVKLWHIRLGHILFSAMKNISVISSTSNSDCTSEICPLARQSRLTFPLALSRLLLFFNWYTLILRAPISHLPIMDTSTFIP